MRNVPGRVRKVDHEVVKAAVRRILPPPPSAKRAPRGRALRAAPGGALPQGGCVRNDLDELLTCWRYRRVELCRAVSTINATERRFREVRRRTRPMGVFDNRASLDRILFTVFTHASSSQGIPTLSPLTRDL